MVIQPTFPLHNKSVVVSEKIMHSPVVPRTAMDTHYCLDQHVLSPLILRGQKHRMRMIFKTKVSLRYGKLTSKRKRMESSSSLCDLFPARQKAKLPVNAEPESDSKITLLFSTQSQRCWITSLHLYLISKAQDLSKRQHLSLPVVNEARAVPQTRKALSPCSSPSKRLFLRCRQILPPEICPAGLWQRASWTGTRFSAGWKPSERAEGLYRHAREPSLAIETCLESSSAPCGIPESNCLCSSLLLPDN